MIDKILGTLTIFKDILWGPWDELAVPDAVSGGHDLGCIAVGQPVVSHATIPVPVRLHRRPPSHPPRTSGGGAREQRTSDTDRDPVHKVPPRYLAIEAASRFSWCHRGKPSVNPSRRVHSGPAASKANSALAGFPGTPTRDRYPPDHTPLPRNLLNRMQQHAPFVVKAERGSGSHARGDRDVQEPARALCLRIRLLYHRLGIG